MDVMFPNLFALSELPFIRQQERQHQTPLLETELCFDFNHQENI